MIGYKDYPNVKIFTHPLIQHKISLMRDKNTGTNEFRKLAEEVAMLEGYEALSDLPTKEVEIETPIEKCTTTMIAGRKLALVPILRAGLGMVPGLLSLVPSAKVGHIGLYRNEVTHEPVEYYCKLPNPISSTAACTSNSCASSQLRKASRSFPRLTPTSRSTSATSTASSTKTLTSARASETPATASSERSKSRILHQQTQNEKDVLQSTSFFVVRGGIFAG